MNTPEPSLRDWDRIQAANEESQNIRLVFIPTPSEITAETNRLRRLRYCSLIMSGLLPGHYWYCEAGIPHGPYETKAGAEADAEDYFSIR